MPLLSAAHDTAVDINSSTPNLLQNRRTAKHEHDPEAVLDFLT